MIRAAAVLFVVVFGFVLGASAQDFKAPEAEFGVDGLRVRPAGEGPLDHASGHHHLIIDGRPIPLGQTVPADDKHLHFGKGETQAQITLPPGRHTLTLQFADGAHRSYGPKWAATIRVNVG
jgi:Domain of unknown function (DUF4399)